MHFQNNSTIAIQVMPEHDEVKHGTFLPIGAESWNWVIYMNLDLFMAFTGNSIILSESGVWK